MELTPSTGAHDRQHFKTLACLAFGYKQNNWANEMLGIMGFRSIINCSRLCL